MGWLQEYFDLILIVYLQYLIKLDLVNYNFLGSHVCLSFG